MVNLNVTEDSVQGRVLNGLRGTNKGLTGKQIESRYSVGNARATVSALRMKGFPIYANEHKDTKGRTKTFYRLSTPSRKVIAAGYAALAKGLV